MKSIFYIIFFSLFTFSSYAQGVNQTEMGNLDSFSSPLFMTSSAGIYINNYGSDKIQKLFLFNDFDNKAILFDQDDKAYKIANFNIDLNNNTFVSMYKKDSLYNFQNVDKAIINNHHYRIENNQVYQLISEGSKLQVKVHYYAKEMEEIKDKLNGKLIKPKHFVVRKEYLFLDQINNKKQTLSRLKKKLVIAMFKKEYKKIMTDYIKENNLGYKDQKDIKSIFDYYNTL